MADEMDLPTEEWVTRQDVALLDAHIVEDRLTGKETIIDRQKLEEIAGKMNARSEVTGDETPIVIGHTRDHLMETEQPPIVGYATGFYVQEHPKSGKPILYARDYRVYKKNVINGEEMSGEEVLKRFPRRSPEVWVKDGIIDPISLLGATTPMRDLGLVRMQKPVQKRAGKPLKYGMAPMDASAIIMAMESMINQLKTCITPVGDQAESPLEQETGLELDAAGPMGADDPLGDGAPMGGEEDAGEPDKDVGNLSEDVADETGDDEDPMKYQAGQDAMGSAPSSSNGYLPGDDDMDKKQYDHKAGAVCSDPTLDRVKMQRDQEAIKARKAEERANKLEAQVKAIQDRMNEDRLKYQRDVRTADLEKLRSDGYTLDVAEEIEELAGMDEEAYGKRLTRIKARYSRVPVGEDFIRTKSVPEGGPQKVEGRAAANRAADIAARTGKDFGEVLRQVQNGEI